MGKITSYDAAASLASTDIIPCVVDPGSTPVTKKATVAVLQTAALTGGTFISLGATPASAGAVRLSNAMSIRVRNSANSADLSAVETTGADVLGIGTDLSFTAAKQFSSINVYCTTSGSVALGVAATTYQYVTGGANEMWKPVTGSSVGSSPYGVHGVGAQAITDGADTTAAAAVYRYYTIKTTGAITADRNLILPAATDAAAYTKVINNTCTGAYSVIVKDGGAGTTVTVGNGKSAMVLFDSRGVTRLTADV